ncbi:MAG: hypothetical protein IKP15_08175 [Bacteroidales bacterium]|nr:hypothetical protein [Bacteroidales bacterium]
MSEAKVCCGSRLSGLINSRGRRRTLFEGEGGGDFGADGRPLGQLAGDFLRPVAVQTLQNIRETAFHPYKNKHFSTIIYYICLIENNYKTITT